MRLALGARSLVSLFAFNWAGCSSHEMSKGSLDAGADMSSMSANGDMASPTDDAAPVDSFTDQSDCISDRHIECALGTRSGDLGYCDDTTEPAICEDGQLRCRPGTIEVRFCTCSGQVMPQCRECTPSGWRCTDAGMDGSGDGTAFAPDEPGTEPARAFTTHKTFLR
jgi:hypothetical protein